jgi:hypothetical protein
MDVGTCSQCGRRFVVMQATARRHAVVSHHNDVSHTSCLGAGIAPVAGSTTYQTAGSVIVRGSRRT